ncbi:MAG: hypothetical protein ACOCVV_07965 [Marinobacter sp.]
MKLHYFHGRTPLHTLVLWRSERRVELHVKKVASGVWSVIALAGRPDGQPDATRCQGPYQDRERAEAGLRQLTGSLLERGYDPSRNEPVQWTVCAQRLARDLRLQAQDSDGRYRFDPEQPEPTL